MNTARERDVARLIPDSAHNKFTYFILFDIW
jgi:hypothetical protein